MVKIFVGNLNPGADAAALRKKFEEYGQVNECDVVNNFGFVHMEKEIDAEAAIAALNYSEFHGSKINVELSHGKKKTAAAGGPMRGMPRFGYPGAGAAPYPPPLGMRGGRGSPYMSGPPGMRGGMRGGRFPPPPGPSWDNGYSTPFPPPPGRGGPRGAYGAGPNGYPPMRGAPRGAPRGLPPRGRGAVGAPPHAGYPPVRGRGGYLVRPHMPRGGYMPPAPPAYDPYADPSGGVAAASYDPYAAAAVPVAAPAPPAAPAAEYYDYSAYGGAAAYAQAGYDSYGLDYSSGDPNAGYEQQAYYDYSYDYTQDPNAAGPRSGALNFSIVNTLATIVSMKVGTNLSGALSGRGCVNKLRFAPSNDKAEVATQSIECLTQCNQ